jgi:hypothetical protein
MPQSDMLLEDLQGKTKTELQNIAGNLLAECHDHHFNAHKKDAEILKLKAQVAQLRSGEPEIKNVHYAYLHRTSAGEVKSVRVWDLQPYRDRGDDIVLVMAFELNDAFCPEGHSAFKVGGEDVCEWAYLPHGTDIGEVICADISLMDHGYPKDSDFIKLAWEAVYLHSVLGYGQNVTGIAE